MQPEPSSSSLPSSSIPSSSIPSSCPLGWLARRARLSPQAIAFVDTVGARGPVTFDAFFRRCTQTARFLQQQGVRRGDRVAVLAQNSLEVLELWMGCGLLGALFQPLNWRLTEDELRFLVEDSGASLLCYGPEYGESARALRARCPSLQQGLRLERAEAAWEGDALLERCLEHSELELPPSGAGPNDPWVLCYTGGTTGLPKGAILTFDNILWNAIGTVSSWGLSRTDVTFLNAPLFHTGGLNVLTAPLLWAGGTSIVCRSFSPDQVFDLIEGEGVTVFFGVPTMFIALQQHARWASADFSRLRFVISGGAPCPTPVFETFWKKGVSFKTGYGLTEAGPNTFWLPPEEVRSKPGAVGVPLLHVQARVVRADGSVCAPAEVGELLIAGPHVFRGYWGKPEESARTLEGGWLHTGDLASRDSEGCFRIVGRLKELIISGGENIYPAEVESVLAAHPAVGSVALIGVPDAHWGEVGRAIVTVRPGMSLTQAELLEFCRSRLARYKIPKSVIQVDALPLTGAGKIDRVTLRSRYGGRSLLNAPAGEERRGRLAVGAISLAYRLRGSGPPLVLISGLGYGAWFWEGLVPHLSQHFTVLTFDNRGAGESDKPPGPYSTPGMARDVAALLRGLELPPAVVLGHSLGGFIAQELALGWPEQVRGLILCSTSCGGSEAIPVTPQALQVMLDRSGDPRDLFERGIRLATAPGFMARQPDLVEALWEYRRGVPVPPDAYAAQVMAGAGHDAASRLSQLDCPVLILCGEEDQIVPPANAALLASKLKPARHSQTQVTLLPGVGHLFPLEAPETTLKGLLEWMMKLPPP